MSPGTTRIRKKMITATPNRVGIIRSKRLMMYLVTARRPLIGQPHAVELVVDEVAGRDGPATELGAVRDDAVPLERVGVVRLLVQQSPLEVADVFPSAPRRRGRGSVSGRDRPASCRRSGHSCCR